MVKYYEYTVKNVHSMYISESESPNGAANLGNYLNS